MAIRKYQKKRRAEQEADTRQRIVEAMVALHREVGPARTTIRAIADRAGVERLTVYRHFGDEVSMLRACSSHFTSQIGLPDPAAWSAIPDPAERMRAALLAFYGYYRRGEDMHDHVFRDAAQLPALREVLAPWGAFVAGVRDRLLEGWSASGESRPRLAATVMHALQFETWRSFASGGGLGDEQTAELMVEFARVASGQTVERDAPVESG